MSRLNLENSRLENPVIATGLRYGITALADAAATLDADMGPILYFKGTASRTLTLPLATPALKGLTFIILNAAAFTIVVQNPTPTTVATVPATVGATGMFVCLGDTTQGVGGWSGGL
jgi:hypothetical protein